MMREQDNQVSTGAAADFDATLGRLYEHQLMLGEEEHREARTTELMIGICGDVIRGLYSIDEADMFGWGPEFFRFVTRRGLLVRKQAG